MAYGLGVQMYFFGWIPLVNLSFPTLHQLMINQAMKFVLSFPALPYPSRLLLFRADKRVVKRSSVPGGVEDGHFYYCCPRCAADLLA